MRGMAMLLALAAAGACDGVFEPDEQVSAIVRVEDQHGRALRPDSVTWYYDPQSARYDGEHRAICLNRACTVWGVPPEVAGQAYVAVAGVGREQDRTILMPLFDDQFGEGGDVQDQRYGAIAAHGYHPVRFPGLDPVGKGSCIIFAIH